MRMRRLAAPALAAAVLLGSKAPAADPKLDANGDPLPEGAIARLGPARPVRAGGFVPLPPDYTTFPTLTADGLRLRQVETGRPVGPGTLPPDVGRVVAVSSDGKRAAVALAKVFKVVAVPSGETVGEVRPEAGAGQPWAIPVSLSADGSRLAYGWPNPGNGLVVVWDVAKGEVAARVAVPYTQPITPVLSPDGSAVAVGGGHQPPAPAPGRPADDPGPALRVYRLPDGAELFRVPVTPYAPPAAVAFAPDGKAVATGQGEGPVELREVPSGRLVRTLLGRTGQGHRLAFAADGGVLAAVAVDGTVERWALPDGKRLGATELPAGLPAVIPLGVGFTPDGRVRAWGQSGIVGVMWEAPAGALRTPTPEHPAGVFAVAFAAGGKEVVSAGPDARVVRWDAATGKPVGRLSVRARRVVPPGHPLDGGGHRPPLHLSADGTRGFAADHTAAVFDLATGAERFVIPPGGTNGRTGAVFVPSADLSRVAVVTPSQRPTASGRLTVWDVPGERTVFETEVPGLGLGRAVGFSLDNGLVVAALVSRDPTGRRETVLVTAWDLATGRKAGEVEDLGASNALGLAVTGRTSAVVAGPGRLYAVDFAAGRVGDEVRGPRGSLWPVVFSPDGTRFAVPAPLGDWNPDAPGVWSTGVRVYDWPGGNLLRTFTGHTAAVAALRFSPDGKTLASGSQDGTVLLWDVADLLPKK